jgi:TonB family protein
MKARINRIILRLVVGGPTCANATVSLLLFVLPAAAQEGGIPAESAPPALLPPQLLESVEAAYPEPAKAARLEGTVVLRLSIDAEGRVTQAEVTQSAGNGFDEAAREAALRFRFQPAKRNGESIAARILFPYEFRLPPEPPPAAPADEDAGVAFEPEPLVVAPPPPSAATAAEPVEVTVAGARTEGEQLQQSAEAVTVIDTYRAKQQAADLGEALARTQGVAVRRSGGLGSNTRFSLNGLYDDQIRFFLDEIPLDLAGYPFGVVDVPPNLVDRVEVYRGVVPIRFGADALGGAVNLVSDTSYVTHAGASYPL